MKKGKILLGEESEMMAIAMTCLLRGKVTQLDLARSAKELMEKYQTTDYDYILLNTGFQDILKVTREIRAQEAAVNGKFTPLIGIFLEKSEEESRRSNVYQKYFDAGMTAIFFPPFSDENTNKILEKYLLSSR